MTAAARLLGSVVMGVATGAAVLVLALIAATAYAWSVGEEARVPGVFSASFSEENGAPALTVDPSPGGMLVVVLLVTGTTVGATLLRMLRVRGAARRG